MPLLMFATWKSQLFPMSRTCPMRQKIGPAASAFAAVAASACFAAAAAAAAAIAVGAIAPAVTAVGAIAPAVTAVGAIAPAVTAVGAAVPSVVASTAVPFVADEAVPSGAAPESCVRVQSPLPFASFLQLVSPAAAPCKSWRSRVFASDKSVCFG